MGSPNLISTGSLAHNSLAGQVAIVTGAGGGIGFEAARALAWLGARVVIAEIDGRTGKAAAERVAQEMGAGAATFVRTDVGGERSVERLARQALRTYGKVDVVLNNATVWSFGAVKDNPIRDWDASYRVNLRGPVLLARAFLPGMLERNYGVFVCVSSVGDKYMGAYEVYKAAQVHLARTLDAELEGTGVHAFTIGPGLVPTATARAGIELLAPLYGKTAEELWAMNAEHTLSVEAAGAGFAAAIALAWRFRGQEISSKQALIAAGIDFSGQEQGAASVTLTAQEIGQALALCRDVRATLAEQAEGWAKRSLFERQWVLRDFKSNAGMPVEQWLETLERLERYLEAGDLAALARLRAPLERLARYYGHYQELARGYVKDPQALEEQLRIVRGYQEAAERLAALVSGGR